MINIEVLFNPSVTEQPEISQYGVHSLQFPAL